MCSSPSHQEHSSPGVGSLRTYFGPQVLRSDSNDSTQARRVSWWPFVLGGVVEAFRRAHVLSKRKPFKVCRNGAVLVTLVFVDGSLLGLRHGERSPKLLRSLAAGTPINTWD